MYLNKTEQFRQKQIIDYIEQVEAGGLHGQLPIVWKKAKDYFVWDEFGNRYIDFTATIFVANCGHSNVNLGMKKQMVDCIHSYTFPTVAKYQFLKYFKSFLPEYCEKIFLASAGSEVASWALKLMRTYKNKKLIVHIDGAFHGKTGQVADLEHEEIKLSFPTTSEQFEADLVALEANKDNIAGIMIESYQGWSARFMNKEYIQKLVAWAKALDIPVCFDDIQGGFYRAGKKFSFDWYEVEPDLFCMGKGLGGGFPISALTGKAKFFNVPGLSSTHSGTPLGCAAAKEALKIYNKLDKKELDEKAEYLASSLVGLRLKYNEVITETNCHGLLASLIFTDAGLATKIAVQCADMGLLVVKTGRESIKIGPPLTITKEALAKGIAILSEAILAKVGEIVDVKRD